MNLSNNKTMTSLNSLPFYFYIHSVRFVRVYIRHVKHLNMNKTHNFSFEAIGFS